MCRSKSDGAIGNPKVKYNIKMEQLWKFYETYIFTNLSDFIWPYQGQTIFERLFSTFKSTWAGCQRQHIILLHRVISRGVLHPKSASKEHPMKNPAGMREVARPVVF